MGVQIQKNEMVGICGMNGGEEGLHAGFWWGNLMERDH